MDFILLIALIVLAAVLNLVCGFVLGWVAHVAYVQEKQESSEPAIRNPSAANNEYGDFRQKTGVNIPAVNPDEDPWEKIQDKGPQTANLSLRQVQGGGATMGLFDDGIEYAMVTFGGPFKWRYVRVPGSTEKNPWGDDAEDPIIRIFRGYGESFRRMPLRDANEMDELSELDPADFPKFFRRKRQKRRRR